MVTKLETEMRLLYNIINMEGMTPQLRAVFDALCDLRLKSGSYIFSFKLSDILKCLDENKESIKYGIGLSEVRDLLDELAIRFNVQLDYVVELDLDNNRVDYRWKYGKYEWVYEDVQVGQDIRDFLGKVYVKIDRPQIKSINDAAEKRIVATLGFKGQSFIVSCGNYRYTLPEMKEGAPLAIVEYIMTKGRVDEPVFREELASECQYFKTIEDTSLKEIFKRNSQVKILSPFITIKARHIIIRQATKLTARELQVIKKASK